MNIELSIVFIFGLTIGSFLNVLIYRIPKNENFMTTRSHCVNCRHILAWYDLIPVLSRVLLSGKCRYCSKVIPIRYSLIELFSGLLFLISYINFFDIGIGVWGMTLITIILFFILSVIDFDNFILPDSIHIFIISVLVVWELVGWTHPYDFFSIFTVNHFLTGLIASSFFSIFWAVSKGRWLGFGDVKLAGIIGFVFGVPATLVVLYSAIVLGGVIGIGIIIMKLLKKQSYRGTKLPLGTFMGVVSIVFLLYPINIDKIIDLLFPYL